MTTDEFLAQVKETFEKLDAEDFNEEKAKRFALILKTDGRHTAARYSGDELSLREWRFLFSVLYRELSKYLHEEPNGKESSLVHWDEL